MLPQAQTSLGVSPEPTFSDKIGFFAWKNVSKSLHQTNIITNKRTGIQLFKDLLFWEALNQCLVGWSSLGVTFGTWKNPTVHRWWKRPHLLLATTATSAGRATGPREVVHINMHMYVHNINMCMSMYICIRLDSNMMFIVSLCIQNFTVFYVYQVTTSFNIILYLYIISYGFILYLWYQIILD